MGTKQRMYALIYKIDTQINVTAITPVSDSDPQPLALNSGSLTTGDGFLRTPCRNAKEKLLIEPIPYLTGLTEE